MKKSTFDRIYEENILLKKVLKDIVSTLEWNCVTDIDTKVINLAKKNSKRFRRGRMNNLMKLGIIFWILETAYFGWNWRPQSQTETICDYIAFGVFLIGYFFVARKEVKS